jgi:anti-anti-sigma factor
MDLTVLDGWRGERATLMVSTRWAGRRAVIEAHGELDTCSAWRLRAATNAAVEGAIELWLDLTHVRLIDSTGLRVLVELRGRMRRRLRQLKVICPDGHARRTIEAAGLADVLKLCDTRDQAHRD